MKPMSKLKKDGRVITPAPRQYVPQEVPEKGEPPRISTVSERLSDIEIRMSNILTVVNSIKIHIYGEEEEDKKASECVATIPRRLERIGDMASEAYSDLNEILNSL